MELEELIGLVSTPDEMIKQVQATKTDRPIEDYQKQYDPKRHAILDIAVRPDKVVKTDEGTKTVPTTRTTMAKQKQIVLLAAAFLCGNPIKLDATPLDQPEKDMLAVIKRCWDDNKLDYESKRLAKLMMAETEVAELWYTEPCEPGYWKGTVLDISAVKSRLRMKILANKYGDKLYPVFSNAGDMIAFARGYSIKVAGKEEEHFDVYTDATIYKCTKGEQWTVLSEKNLTGKIPVMYWDQEVPEWDAVQTNIERTETLISNLGGSNDYSGSPITVLSGEVEGFADKGEQGKVIILKQGAEAKYLESNNAPESIKLEYEINRSIIYEDTNTTDVSMENMKGLGAFSGTALRMLFFGAHLKAADKEEIFGKGIQRRINYMKATFSVMLKSLLPATTMPIKPVFEYYLPKNYEEVVQMLSTATGGSPTMSRKTAVTNNPFVKDVEAELKQMDEDGLNSEIETV